MILSIIDYKEIEEDYSELFEKLIKDFDKISKEFNSKYGLEFSEDKEKIILQKYLFKKIKFGSSIPGFIMGYNGSYFYFEGGIEESIFLEIKEILTKLEQQFLVEVIK